jgi:hypothetical protein
MLFSLLINLLYIISIENQIKKFSRYLTEVELWSLNIRLQQEYLLKKRREELIYYRKNGITKLYDIVKFNLLHYSMVVDGTYIFKYFLN